MDKTQLTRALQCAAAAVIVALAIGLFKAKSDAQRTEAHVRELEHRVSEREADLRALRADIAAQESPGRIEELAREHLPLAIGAAAPAAPPDALDAELPPAPGPAGSRP